MPAHRYTASRRTHRQVNADERAAQLAGFLGRSLRQARTDHGLTQAVAAEVAGLAQSCWSGLERGGGAGVSLRVWERAGDAVHADLRAYLERATGADAPRDAVHLKHQELLARIATRAGWTVDPELSLGEAGVADLVLRRTAEVALIEVWTWFADVGESFRSWDRKLERISAVGDEAMTGCWVIRATRRNRELVHAHRTIFAARFPGSSAAWLSALTERARPMPARPAILWVSVDGSRVFAQRARR